MPAWVFMDWSFYWTLLEFGINGLIIKAEKELNRRKNENDLPEKIEYLTAMVWIYKAF